MPTCPLCSHSQVTLHARARDIEYFTSETWFSFYHCAPCGILFIDPMLSDRLNEIYPPNYYSFVHGKRSIPVAIKEWLDQAQFRKLMKGLPGKELKVLDVGGGTGWLLNLVKKADARVAETTVIDIDPSARARAEQAGHRYFLGRMEDYRDSDDFDLILMLNLLEHVSDPRAILLKARDLLSRTGVVLIKTPNFESLDARLFRNHSWAGYHTPRHFVLFTMDSLKRLCGDCGFEVAASSYTQGAPFWSMSVMEMLHRMGLVDISSAKPSIYHPLTPILQIGFAGFDFMRKPFSKLSQMVFVLRRAT